MNKKIKNFINNNDVIRECSFTLNVAAIIFTIACILNIIMFPDSFISGRVLSLIGLILSILLIVFDVLFFYNLRKKFF